MAISAKDLGALIAALKEPAMGMLAAAPQDDAAAAGCWFGGQPTLPSDTDWPMFDFVPFDDVYSIPMHFRVQIDLESMPRVTGLPALPDAGKLFVFCDSIAAPIENDVRISPLNLGQGCRVIHVSGPVSHHPPRAMPEVSDLSEVPYFNPWMDYDGTTGHPMAAASQSPPIQDTVMLLSASPFNEDELVHC